MGTYVLRRGGQAVIVIFSATLLLYFIAYSMPGDPVAAIVGDGGKSLDEATIARIRAEHNLDKPFVVQYFLYLGGLLTGNWGVTFSGRPVTEIIGQALPVTFRLAVLTILIEIIVGVTMGVIAGKRRGTILDASAMVVTMVLIGVPTFVLGYLVQYFVGVRLGWMAPTVSSQATWLELVVPAAVLAAGSLAFLIRFTRSSVAETVGAEHVRAARARGLSERQITFSHILRPALIPIVTVVGAEFGMLLSGAVLTEAVFNIPGYGQQVYQNIIQGAVAPTASLVTVLVITFVVVNFLVDLTYASLNPKVRYDNA